MRSVNKTNEKSKMIKTKFTATPTETYDHYIAIDWSKKNMAIARLTPNMKEPKVIDTDSDLAGLQAYLKNLSGKKMITIEECNTAQWLYTELREYADRIVICDPYRNRLLLEGPKNDVIDAGKLVVLLRNGLLKEVYHTTERKYHLRKQVSFYQDLVRMGVRLQNQTLALYHSCGLSEHYTIEDLPKTYRRIAEQQNEMIELYHVHKSEYEDQFTQWCKKDKILKNLLAVPGIAKITAVKIIARVIDSRRFLSTGHYLSYCGLVKNQKMSGGKSYGYRRSRYCRILKEAYKTAANAAINGKNPIREYYDYLIQKGIAEHNARHAVARYLARITFGMIKSGQPYQPYRWRKSNMDQ